jgi:hypothetical protein
MADFGIAASELESIARHLRLAGDTELVRKLQKAMTDAVGPVKDEIRANLKPTLPDRYAETLDADLTIRASSAAGTAPHVSVTANTRSKKRKLRRLDAGLLTHPLFGDREHWYTQGIPSVRPGWFTRPAEAAVPRVREKILAALDDVATQAARKGP